MCNKQEGSRTPRSKTPRRSPWKRHQRELQRPKLTRKIVGSARINLNSYWGKFEEFSSRQLPLVSFENSATIEVELAEEFEKLS